MSERDAVADVECRAVAPGPDSTEIVAIEQAHCAYLAWRADAIGAEVRRMSGGGVASLGGGYPDHWYANRIVCASRDDVGAAARLSASVRPVRVELAQPWLDDGTRTELLRAELAPAWEARVVASPLLPTPSAAGVVERVDAGGGDRFWQAYGACFEEVQPERDRHTRALDHDGVFAYTARHGDDLIGVALMFVHERIALLADAATLPAWRRRGVHTELAVARLEDARRAGAQIVTSDVEPNGGSDRNLRRLGLKHGFMREVWSGTG